MFYFKFELRVTRVDCPSDTSSIYQFTKKLIKNKLIRIKGAQFKKMPYTSVSGCR